MTQGPQLHTTAEPGCNRCHRHDIPATNIAITVCLPCSKKQGSLVADLAAAASLAGCTSQTLLTCRLGLPPRQQQRLLPHHTPHCASSQLDFLRRPAAVAGLPSLKCRPWLCLPGSSLRLTRLSACRTLRIQAGSFTWGKKQQAPAAAAAAVKLRWLLCLAKWRCTNRKSARLRGDAHPCYFM
jgi:hypothetical protein